MEKVGLVTGSFDPVTLGHIDIIRRASQLFDKVYVGIFFNTEKTGLFDIETRKEMLDEAIADMGNVSVITSQGQLAVEVARELGVTHLVRGLRNAADLDYEANLEYFNKHLAEEIETVYLVASHDLQPISSSRVRELIHFKADITAFTPESVQKKVENRNEKK